MLIKPKQMIIKAFLCPLYSPFKKRHTMISANIPKNNHIITIKTFKSIIQCVFSLKELTSYHLHPTNHQKLVLTF